MNEIKSLREQSRNWTCNHVSLTNHDGDSVALLRKLADSIEELGDVDVMDITYSKHYGATATEITVTVYFTMSTSA